MGFFRLSEKRLKHDQKSDFLGCKSHFWITFGVKTSLLVTFESLSERGKKTPFRLVCFESDKFRIFCFWTRSCPPFPHTWNYRVSPHYFILYCWRVSSRYIFCMIVFVVRLCDLASMAHWGIPVTTLPGLQRLQHLVRAQGWQCGAWRRLHHTQACEVLSQWHSCVVFFEPKGCNCTCRSRKFGLSESRSLLFTELPSMWKCLPQTSFTECLALTQWNGSFLRWRLLHRIPLAPKSSPKKSCPLERSSWAHNQNGWDVEASWRQPSLHKFLTEARDQHLPTADLIAPINLVDTNRHSQVLAFRIAIFDLQIALWCTNISAKAAGNFDSESLAFRFNNKRDRTTATVRVPHIEQRLLENPNRTDPLPCLELLLPFPCSSNKRNKKKSEDLYTCLSLKTRFPWKTTTQVFFPAEAKGALEKQQNIMLLNNTLELRPWVPARGAQDLKFVASGYFEARSSHTFHLAQ